MCYGLCMSFVYAAFPGIYAIIAAAISDGFGLEHYQVRLDQWRYILSNLAQLLAKSGHMLFVTSEANLIVQQILQFLYTAVRAIFFFSASFSFLCFLF